MRWLWRVLCVIFLCLLVAIYWLLWTPAGTRWSLTMLPALLPDLQVELVDGSWVGGLTVSHLSYRAPVVEVTVSNLSLSVRPLALLGGTLMVRSAAAEQVTLRLIKPEKPSTRKGLPTVSLPLTLSIGRITVPTFELITRGGSRVVADIRTALTWRGTWIDATDATLMAYGYRIDTDLAIELRGDYAVATDLELRIPGQPHVLAAELSGSLVKLEVNGDYRGLAPVRYRGQVALLEPGLPLSLRLAAEPGSALFTGANAVAIADSELQITGDLEQLTGTLQATLDHAQVGRAQLAAPLRWHDGQLFVERARLSSEHGSLTADCVLAAGIARWHCNGRLDELSAAPWYQAMPVIVSSPYQLNGGWDEGSPALVLALPELKGALGGQALRGSIAVASQDWRRWQVQRFSLVAGNNTLDVSGSVDHEFDLQLGLSGDNLGQLSGGLSGALTGNFSLTGPVSAPALSGRVRGRALRFGELSLPWVRGKVDLRALGKEHAEVRLRIRQLRYGKHNLGKLKLSFDGTTLRPQVALSLEGGDHLLAVTCDARQGGHWRLHCAQLEGLLMVQGRTHAFAIDKPLAVEWREPAGELRMDANCLRMEPAALCLDQQLRLKGSDVRGLTLSLRRLPLAWWYGALPAAIVAKPGSYLEMALRVDSLAPKKALLTASVDDVQWTWQAEGETFPASLNAIALRLELDERRALLSGQASSPVLGGLRVKLVVDDPGGRQALDGRVQVERLELRTFSWLSTSIQQLRGVIDGDIGISGTAAAPRLDGALQLRDGLLKDRSLPYPLERVAASLTLHDEWADLTGRFRLNDGDGRVMGRVHWQEQAPKWRFDATVSTDAITLPVLDNSVAGVAAQVTLGMAPGVIDVGGKVRVDHADIRLLSLPPDTISPSPDAEIIGGEVRSAWRLKSDVEVDLGDRLRFRGFGVDMTLKGALRWRNSLRYHNHITGEVKVARGRFRAYGQDLTIRNGRLIFAGIADNPDLRLEAVRQTRDRATVGGLRVTGTLQDPVGEFFAEPSMTDSDVAYLLLTGRRPPEPGQKDASSGGALLNLGLARTNEAAAKLASRLGIEGFQISTADGEKGIETHVSGYLSDDLYVSYGTGFEEQTASLTLQYYITPHIVIEAVGGFTSALDLVYSFRID